MTEKLFKGTDLPHIKLCFVQQVSVNVRAVSSGLGEAGGARLAPENGRFELSQGNEKFLEPRFI